LWKGTKKGLKTYTIACDDCGKYPRFELTKTDSVKVKESHIVLMRQALNETHNPRLVLNRGNKK
jgi:hypothetical protein